jgi:hypothetical protein
MDNKITIPVLWFNRILLDSGKPDVAGIIILTDIANKFNDAPVQIDYRSLSRLYGFTKRQIQEAVYRLKENNLLTVELKTTITSLNTKTANNVYVVPYLDNIAKSKNTITTKRITSKHGYVYFVRGNESNYKIGKCANIKRRFGEYTKLPFEPVIIHCMETIDMDESERLIHNHYSTKRARGEWFVLDDVDINNICSNIFPDNILQYILLGGR